MEHAGSNGRPQAALCHHVHYALQQCLKVELQGRLIEESASRFQLNQDIDVAIGACIIARNGAERAALISPRAGM